MQTYLGWLTMTEEKCTQEHLDAAAGTVVLLATDQTIPDLQANVFLEISGDDQLSIASHALPLPL